jgi:hypothetical protein
MHSLKNNFSLMLLADSLTDEREKKYWKNQPPILFSLIWECSVLYYSGP